VFVPVEKTKKVCLGQTDSESEKNGKRRRTGRGISNYRNGGGETRPIRLEERIVITAGGGREMRGRRRHV